MFSQAGRFYEAFKRLVCGIAFTDSVHGFELHHSPKKVRKWMKQVSLLSCM